MDTIVRIKGAAKVGWGLILGNILSRYRVATALKAPITCDPLNADLASCSSGDVPEVQTDREATIYHNSLINCHMTTSVTGVMADRCWQMLLLGLIWMQKKKKHAGLKLFPATTQIKLNLFSCSFLICWTSPLRYARLNLSAVCTDGDHAGKHWSLRTYFVWDQW